jgi:hypothetical protein
MTPVEKAQDLLHNYEVQVRFSMEDCSFTYRDSNYGLAIKRTAKQCALIAVDEIIKAPHENMYIELIPSDADDTSWFWNKFDEYWNEVKIEIEKL